jgi:hypothetical protein
MNLDEPEKNPFQSPKVSQHSPASPPVAYVKFFRVSFSNKVLYGFAVGAIVCRYLVPDLGGFPQYHRNYAIGGAFGIGFAFLICFIGAMCIKSRKGTKEGDEGTGDS